MNVMQEDINEILDEYAPLVRKIARSACYSSAAIDVADLCQVGEIAVLSAIKAYDPSCGTTIKSFVAKVVRQEVYREAARFLGVFTVDFRVTSLAAKVCKLADKGHDDQEIARILKETNKRNIDADHVRDLRIAYNRRQNVILEDDTPDDRIEEQNIKDLLDSVVRNPIERVILDRHILGRSSVAEIASYVGLNNSQVYALASNLKDRIKSAIEGTTE